MGKVKFTDYIINEVIEMNISDINNVIEDNGFLYIFNVNGLCYLSDIKSYEYV
jgi:filamentous hemagglutinin family protein